MLEMEKDCLACAKKLENLSDAYICSYECTYCPTCAKNHSFVCKNCGGDLQPRPKRNELANNS